MFELVALKERLFGSRLGRDGLVDLGAEEVPYGHVGAYVADLEDEVDFPLQDFYSGLLALYGGQFHEDPADLCVDFQRDVHSLDRAVLATARERWAELSREGLHVGDDPHQEALLVEFTRAYAECHGSA